MNKKPSSRIWIRVLCLVLAGLMVLSVATTVLYVLFGLM